MRLYSIKSCIRYTYTSGHWPYTNASHINYYPSLLYNLIAFITLQSWEQWNANSAVYLHTWINERQPRNRYDNRMPKQITHLEEGNDDFKRENAVFSLPVESHWLFFFLKKELVSSQEPSRLQQQQRRICTFFFRDNTVRNRCQEWFDLKRFVLIQTKP